MAGTREQALLGAFTALESAHFYSAALPSIMTIRKFATDAEAVRAIRQGEAIATGMAVLLGWVVSELTDSHLPFLMSLGVAFLMLIMYEYALKGELNARTIAGAGAMTVATAIPGVPPFP